MTRTYPRFWTHWLVCCTLGAHLAACQVNVVEGTATDTTGDADGDAGDGSTGPTGTGWDTDTTGASGSGGGGVTGESTDSSDDGGDDDGGGDAGGDGDAGGGTSTDSGDGDTGDDDGDTGDDDGDTGGDDGDTGGDDGDTGGDDGDTGGGDDGGDILTCDPHPDQDNACQACMRKKCCDEVKHCSGDPACLCWFRCMGSHYDIAECLHRCGDSGKQGQLVSCSASRCDSRCKS